MDAITSTSGYHHCCHVQVSPLPSSSPKPRPFALPLFRVCGRSTVSPVLSFVVARLVSSCVHATVEWCPRQALVALSCTTPVPGIAQGRSSENLHAKSRWYPSVPGTRASFCRHIDRSSLNLSTVGGGVWSTDCPLICRLGGCGGM